ncbi:MAG: hypothetical protein J6I97_07620 [Agathobacter sp.]|nr:hypothetical protein [Agathobacter sp.]
MLTFLLSACGNEECKTMKITDFEQYKELQKDPLSLIVEYDDAYVGTYEILDQELIEQAMEILFERTSFVKGDSLAAGGNSSLILKYEDGSEVRISLYRIRENDECYYYTSSDLLDLVYKIGMDNNELTEK